MHFSLSADVGNAKLKSVIVETTNNILKVVTQRTVTSRLAVLPRSFSEEDEAVIVSNLLNNMIVHVSSPALKRPGYYAVGEKANAVGKTPRNMDIDKGDKHSQEQYVLLPLSTIAARAVQIHYELYKEIPNDLNVTVDYATALPAREYTPENVQKAKNLFLSGEHIVLMYATKKPTTVRISFNKVKVYEEGVPALEAIKKGNDSMFTLYEQKYKELFNKEILMKSKILLADIGDGTLEAIYLEYGKPNVDKSNGARLGVGHAADEAIKLLLDNLDLEIKMSRQQFMDITLNETHPYHENAVEALEETHIEQVEMIYDFIRNHYLNVLLGDVHLIIVAGGGSVTFEKELSPMIYEFGEDAKVRVLWIPEQMAHALNAMGLDIFNRFEGEDLGE